MTIQWSLFVPGALLLNRSLAIVVTRRTVEPVPAYWLMLAIFAAAVLSQVYTRLEPHVLLAPIGFVAGMVVALVPWPVALLGVAVAVVGLFAFRQFQAFFVVGLAAVALLGLVLDAHVAWFGSAAGVLSLLLLVGLATGSALELPTRSAVGPRHSPKISS